eukprot:5538944-Amphidinium_carterae.1
MDWKVEIRSRLDVNGTGTIAVSLLQEVLLSIGACEEDIGHLLHNISKVVGEDVAGVEGQAVSLQRLLDYLYTPDSEQKEEAALEVRAEACRQPEITAKPIRITKRVDGEKQDLGEAPPAPRPDWLPTAGPGNAK